MNEWYSRRRANEPMEDFVREVRADLVRVAGVKLIGRHQIEGARGEENVRAMVTDTHEGLLIELEGYLAAIGEDEVEVSRPIDWWEAFKERWFPRWALRRWPVMRRVFKRKVYAAVCPHHFHEPVGRHLCWLESKRA